MLQCGHGPDFGVADFLGKFLKILVNVGHFRSPAATLLTYRVSCRQQDSFKIILFEYKCMS